MCDENEWRHEMNASITRVFNRFAGKTVDPGDPNDPVLAEMRREAAMHYSTLSLVPPGTDRDDPAQITRINAELLAGKDGRWRIGNRFFRG